VDLAISVFGAFEDDLDFLDSEFLAESGKNMSHFSALEKWFIEIKEESESYHDGAVAFLVENAETLDEILESSVLLLLGAEFDVVDELVEVAGLFLIQLVSDLKIINDSYLGVHFLLFGAAERFQNIGVGGLEAEASDEITDLVEVELALARSIVQLETVLDIFNLILGEVNLKC
jgi:hypothetical protein